MKRVCLIFFYVAISKVFFNYCTVWTTNAAYGCLDRCRVTVLIKVYIRDAEMWMRCDSVRLLYLFVCVRVGGGGVAV